MKLHEYYFNDNNGMLYVEFSTKEDGDDFYRTLELNFNDVGYYSSDIIYEDDLENLTKDLVIDVIQNYINENGLPDQIIL
jgi:hypothetical protein